MLKLVISIIVLAVLYGLAWHNPPPKERGNGDRGRREVHTSTRERNS